MSQFIEIFHQEKILFRSWILHWRRQSSLFLISWWHQSSIDRLNRDVCSEYRGLLISRQNSNDWFSSRQRAFSDWCRAEKEVLTHLEWLLVYDVSYKSAFPTHCDGGLCPRQIAKFEDCQVGGWCSDNFCVRVSGEGWAPDSAQGFNLDRDWSNGRYKAPPTLDNHHVQSHRRICITSSARCAKGTYLAEWAVMGGMS